MNARKAAIVELLQEKESVRIRDLASRFEVSQMTIRRDLDEMAENGMVIRTHGGAIPSERLRFLESALCDATVSPEKVAIGKLAASLVSSGQTIMVDAGTTALEVARSLPQSMRITVATTSLCVAQLLHDSPIDVLLLGGFLRKEFPSMYGPMTESMLGGFHVDTLFIGCDGASSVDGFYTTEARISSLEQTMIRIAERVVLVSESSKFGRRAFVRYATPGDVDVVVTDGSLSDQDRHNLEEQGVEVLIARNQ